MPISGLVVVCRGASHATRRALETNEAITMGVEEVTGRIPVVLETDTDKQHRTQLKAMRDLVGVSHVELAYADYRSDADSPCATSVKGRTHR